MPVYDFMEPCPNCGETEVWEMKVIDGPDLVCDCGAPATKKMSAAAFTGVGNDRRIYSKQLGKSFANAKELDAYCEANGMVAVSNGSTEWREVVDGSKQDAEDMAVKMGYRNRSEYEQDARNVRDGKGGKLRDMNAANRQAKIDAYESEHGTGDRIEGAVDNGFGGKLQEGKLQVGYTGD
jgi:hypothetical protein